MAVLVIGEKTRPCVLSNARQSLSRWCPLWPYSRFPRRHRNQQTNRSNGSKTSLQLPGPANSNRNHNRVPGKCARQASVSPAVFRNEILAAEPITAALPGKADDGATRCITGAMDGGG